MKRLAIFVIAFVGLFFVVTLISNLPVRGDDRDRNRREREREDEKELEVEIGFAISPIQLSSIDLKGKDPELVGLGSYIVNAQGGCNDCHTCPSYDPSPYPGHPKGHNPFPPPVGDSGDGQINSANYLAGGVNFGVAVSANLTPDATGKPEGLTLEQFEIAIRTGHDPVRNDDLTVMPWPIYRHMTGRDLDAIYTYLSVIPSATPGSCANAGQ
jgi:hypothetical protein